MEARCDVVVVGAGLLGLASARALARRGRSVILLETAEVGHEDGGSKGSCRIFRLGYDDADWVRMAMRARESWAELEDECGRKLLQPTPHVTFGPGMDAVRQAMRSAGAPHDFLPAEAVAASFPEVATGGPAVLELDSCVISADSALRALAAAVPDIRTGALLRGSGITVPGTPTQEQVGYLATTDGTRPGVPIVIGHGSPELYGLPVPGEPLYKIGVHHGGPVTDPDHQEHGPDQDLSAQLTGLARKYLPGLAPDLMRTERCVYDNSPDQDFIVDRVGRIVIGSGTSGHGFKFGPLLGEWLADLATGAGADPAARRFSLDRFRAAAGH